MDISDVAMYLGRHPVLVAVLFTALVGAVGYNTFEAGMVYQRLRCAVSAADRMASEAMGG